MVSIMRKWKKVELIEEYIKYENLDYEWHDNHGELIRCRDCKYYHSHKCDNLDGLSIVRNDKQFCSYAERKDDIDAEKQDD